MRHNNHTYVLLPQQFENFISSRTQNTMCTSFAQRKACQIIQECTWLSQALSPTVHTDAVSDVMRVEGGEEPIHFPISKPIDRKSSCTYTGIH